MNFLSPRLLRSLFILFASLILIPLAPQFAQAQSQSTPPAHKAPPSTAPPPAVDQQQFISYWTTETGWHTELQLRNNQVKQILTVTPVLRATDGTETPLFPVVVQPQEVKTIDVATAIGTSAPQLIGAYGSLALRYKASSQTNLYAVGMVMGIGHSVAFHIDAIGEDNTENIGSREGIWWLPNATVTSYLILTNQGQNPLQTTLSMSDAAGKTSTQTITVPPRGMQRYSMRQIIAAAKLSGSYGGIKVAAASQAGSLDTLHVVFEQSGGLSAVMKMFGYDPRVQPKERDYAGTGKWTLRAPMLALSNPDPALAFPEGTVLQPQLFIRNVTAKPVDATLAFNWRSGAATGATQPSALHLSPYETRRIDVAALQDGNTLPQTAEWASVTLATSSLPDEVVAVAASYDQSLRYGAQTPFSDQLAFHWAGSQWEYDPYHDSIITAGNGGTKPTQAAFTIFYNQGTQKYELDQTLLPGEQMWMDIGKLIRESIPDKNGKTLPQDLTSGSYDIRDLGNKGIGALFEGKIMYDTTYGHVTYGCGVCCAYKPPVLLWNPLGIPFQGTSANGVDAYDTCYNSEETITYLFNGNWSTANSSIATVDAYGTHTGQGLGSTTTSTWASIQNWEPHSFICPIEVQRPGGGDNVNPIINNISPSRGLISATTQVTINGDGLLGGHINTPAAILVQNITVATNTQIVFDAVVSSSATPGNNAGAIYVTVDSLDSNSENFYVQVPTSLSMISGTASGTTEKLCTSTTCGTIVSFQYQVYDQDSPAQPIQNVMSIWDSFGSYNPDGLNLQGQPFVTTCSPNDTNGGPCGVNTTASGTFTEAALGACSTVCCVGGACVTGGPSDVTQTWHVAAYTIAQQITEYCQKLLVNGTQVQ
jgi:hypothetical protein